MKIAVYGVAKNEEANVPAWYKSSIDADYHLILDTGSTDKTVDIAKSYGINVISASFNPWDETLAKNVALSLLPSDIDYCIMLDLDQKIKTVDWKKILIDNEAFRYHAVEHYLVDNIDMVNNSLNKTSIKSIHHRKNMYWHKYRPRLETYALEMKYIDLDIEIENIIGNEERFSDREVLYQDAWKREYIKIIKNSEESDKVYKLEIIAHQAFNFYERDLFDHYLEKYQQFLDTYNSLSENSKNNCSTLYSTFLLANALYDTKNAKEILMMVPEESSLKLNANYKLAIIDFWENGQKSDILLNFSEYEFVSLYADTKTGRHKFNLAEKAYNYYFNKE